MKSIIIVLAGLFLVLQSKLWLAPGGISEVVQLQKQIALQTHENDHMIEQNAALVAEVNDLKSGRDAVEERARNDLGMVKAGEVYYQIVS